MRPAARGDPLHPARRLWRLVFAGMPGRCRAASDPQRRKAQEARNERRPAEGLSFRPRCYETPLQIGGNKGVTDVKIGSLALPLILALLAIPGTANATTTVSGSTSG